MFISWQPLPGCMHQPLHLPLHQPCAQGLHQYNEVFFVRGLGLWRRGFLVSSEQFINCIFPSIFVPIFIIFLYYIPQHICRYIIFHMQYICPYIIFPSIFDPMLYSQVYLSLYYIYSLVYMPHFWPHRRLP